MARGLPAAGTAGLPAAGTAALPRSSDSGRARNWARCAEAMERGSQELLARRPEGGRKGGRKGGGMTG
jgi:hypothetical protein